MLFNKPICEGIHCMQIFLCKFSSIPINFLISLFVLAAGLLCEVNDFIGAFEST